MTHLNEVKGFPLQPLDREDIPDSLRRGASLRGNKMRGLHTTEPQNSPQCQEFGELAQLNHR